MREGLRWRLRSAGVGLLAAGLLAAAPLGGRAAETIPALTTADVRQATSAAAARLAREMEELTQGRARIELGEAAADTASVLDRVRRGEATLGLVRVAEMAALAPEVALLTVPFLFRDQQKAVALLEATWLGPLLQDELREHGLEPLGFLNGGALRLAGQQAASALAGAQGQQVAARPGELRAAAFRALGLEPVPAAAGQPAAQAPPLAELRTDDLAAAAAAGRAGLQVAEAPHAYDLVALVANRARFGELPLDIRESLRTGVQEIATWQRGALDQAEALALAGVGQQGGRLVALPEDQLRQAHERVKAGVLAALRDADPSIVGTLMAYAD